MPPFSSKRSSLRDFLHLLFKRKYLMLLFFFGTLAFVATVTFLTPKVYEAQTRVFVKFDRDSLYLPQSGGKSTFIDFNEQINAEKELLQSRSLIDRVVKSFGPGVLYETADFNEVVLRLDSAIKISRIKGSNIIDIRYKHNDPELAAQVLNTLVQKYLDFHLSVHKDRESYDFFREQTHLLKQKLDRSQKELETFKHRFRITDLAEEQRLLLRQIAEVRSSIDQTVSQQAELGIRVQQLQLQLGRTPKTISTAEEIDHSPVLISNLETRLIDLKLRKAELLSKYASQNRLVTRVAEEISLVESTLTKLRTRRYGRSQKALNATHQKLQEDLLRDQAAEKAVVGKLDTQLAQLERMQSKLNQLNQIAIELNQLQQVVDVNRQNHRLYLSRFEEARITDAMDIKKITNVSLMEPAYRPLKPVSPNVILNLALGLLVAGFGAIGLAFGLEYFDDSLETPEDVDSALNVPVLASIPELATGPQRAAPG